MMPEMTEEQLALYNERMEKYENSTRRQIDNILCLIEDERAVQIIRPYLEFFATRLGAFERRLVWLEMSSSALWEGQHAMALEKFRSLSPELGVRAESQRQRRQVDEPSVQEQLSALSLETSLLADD